MISKNNSQARLRNERSPEFERKASIDKLHQTVKGKTKFEDIDSVRYAKLTSTESRRSFADPHDNGPNE